MPRSSKPDKEMIERISSLETLVSNHILTELQHMRTSLQSLDNRLWALIVGVTLAIGMEVFRLLIR